MNREGSANNLTCCSIQGNPSQQKAIRHFRGPCEVIAGPGSGKTFVLVERILFLIQEHHIPPAAILVLTFSKAAARQMQERFRRRARGLPMGAADAVSFGTFHSVFLYLLQTSSARSYSVIDTDRSRKLLSTLFFRYHPEVNAPGAEDISQLSSQISLLKSGTSEQTLVQDPVFWQLFTDYSRYLKENALLDYDDMISECIRMLKNHPSVLEFWQKRFQYFLIDEFQDINQEQFEGIRLLAGGEQNLFVVGDDDQSIYGFRGSDPGIMIRFSTIFPSSEMIQLSANYRSVKPIVDCGQRIIQQNAHRISKKPVAVRTSDEGGVLSVLSESRTEYGSSCVRLLPYESEADEYAGVCLQLQKMTAGERENTAVIFRGHRQMQGLKQELEKCGLSYHFPSSKDSTGGRDHCGTIDRKSLLEAEDLLQTVGAYYRLSEEMAADCLLRKDLFQILNVPERFLLRSRFQKSSYRQKELCEVYPRGCSEREQLEALCRDLRTLQRLSPPHSCCFLLRRLRCETPLCGSILNIAEGCTTPGEFYRALQRTTPYALAAALQDKNRTLRREGASPEGKGILLTTMHASKGLEFSTVFIPDLNEGIFPGHHAKTEEAVEEERRLFYVAITRAKDRLNLLYIRGTEQNPRRPSRFLEPLGVKPWE
jgi:DNA helicase II / ATP-dependent DNA helicase PcrA